jgi:beta-glucosidase
MTTDEKLAQIGCVWSTQLADEGGFSEAKAEKLLVHGTGHVTRIGASTGLRPRESASFMNRIQRFLVERTRLGIPAVVHEESCAGLCARDATQFPQAIGLAASFDPELVERIAGVIRAQMLAVGARHALAPVLDVARDPRWGRIEETFGEDPYLVGRLGVAYVRGLQTDDLARGVVCTGKHFVGYGASDGGHNWAPARIPARELREVYAAPFEAAIREAGLASVMNAYHELDGIPCGASKEILDDLLRGELGFEGTVVADYFTVATLQTYHKVAADNGEAARRALEAGLDMELPALDCFGAPLRAEIERGRVPIALVDRAVRRVLVQKLALGLFERPYVDADAAAAVYDTPEQRALARLAAAKSLVLLRNEGDLLPLDRERLRRIAVIGPSADDVRLHQGDYHYPAHLEIIYERPGRVALLPRPDEVAFAPGPFFPRTVTLLEGIRSAAEPGTEILHAKGCEITGDSRAGFAEATAAARRAEVAIVCVGGRSGLVDDCTSGEFNDSAHLGLTGAQQALVEAIVATGTPTVVVLVNGRPLALPWIAEHVRAVLEAWIPGEEGGHAIAAALFGGVNPAGRLPVSIPRHVGQLPVHYDHKPSGRRSQIRGDYTDLPSTPLYPFGHGLSYTRFEYANLAIEPARIAPDGEVAISLDVRNAGDRDGCEVVQLYLNDAVASATRPVKELRGFARVEVVAGRSRRVGFRLDASQLGFYDPEMRFVVEPGTIRVMVGASSEDIRLEGRFEIDGKTRELSRAEIVPTRVEVR